MTGTKEHLARRVVALGFPNTLEGWEFGDDFFREAKCTEIKLDQMVSQCLVMFGVWALEGEIWKAHDHVFGTTKVFALLFVHVITDVVTIMVESASRNPRFLKAMNLRTF